jgi:hypothetical protein
MALAPNPVAPGRLRRALDFVGFGVCTAIGILLGVGFAMSMGPPPLDADLYWRKGQASHYYGTTWGANADSFYIYPPPLAQVAGAIPWPPFVAIWMPLVFLGLWIATRWWSAVVVLVGIAAVLVGGFHNPPAAPFALTGIGNAQALVAGAIVLGLRWPAAWAIVILTKIGPRIGILWFAARGEWRNLAIATGVTAGVAAFSWALAPGAWADFIQFAITNANATPPIPVVAVPLAVRVGMSCLLIVWGARTNRRWTVPIAAGWSSLALYESSALSIWMAALPLMGEVPTPVRRRLRPSWLARRLAGPTVVDDTQT